jgi:hypothetical protein
VTDALVVLGLLPFETLAGGALRLERAAAWTALDALAKKLGLGDAAAAAAGVLAVANAHMEAALRRVSVEQGEDPRGSAIVAYGGAGGLHACALADSLGARSVVWPRHAGVLCALGALTGGSHRERSRSVLRDARDTAALERDFRALERRVLGEFAPAERTRVSLSRHAEVRYRGQAHDIEIAATDLSAIAPVFHAAHRRRFGFDDRARDVIVMSVQVRGALAADVTRERLPRPRPLPIRRADVREAGRSVPAEVLERGCLSVGERVRGPVIVVDDGATLWVPSGWSGVLSEGGALALTRRRRDGAPEGGVGGACAAPTAWRRAAPGCSPRAPRRWAPRSCAPRTRPTSPSGSTTRARCSTPRRAWSRRRRTFRCIWAACRARSRPRARWVRSGAATSCCSTIPSTAGRTCRTSRWSRRSSWQSRAAGPSSSSRVARITPTWAALRRVRCPSRARCTRRASAFRRCSCAAPACRTARCWRCCSPTCARPTSAEPISRRSWAPRTPASAGCASWPAAPAPPRSWRTRRRCWMRPNAGRVPRSPGCRAARGALPTRSTTTGWAARRCASPRRRAAPLDLSASAPQARGPVNVVLAVTRRLAVRTALRAG